MTAIDIELALSRYDRERYSIDVRITEPDTDSETRPLAAPVPISFDFDALRQYAQHMQQYGVALGEMVFKNEEVHNAIEQARHLADRNNAPLRIRIAIERTNTELHTLRWEALRDPRRPNQPLLSSGERLFFSRYLSSPDFQPIKSRARGDLRALVVIANPQGLDRFRLQALDVPYQVQLARQALSGIHTTILGEQQPATFEALIHHLRQGYDIIYLMAHASEHQEETILFLEDAQHQISLIKGHQLVTQIEELIERPRLVVLAACQSAASNTRAATTLLGPKLAIAGIPAVIAMQGFVSLETVQPLLHTFFEELQRDGQVDRALAIARSCVRERHDFWMPVLFMRLKSGKLWYKPGFTDQQSSKIEEKWEPLLESIRDEICTPILGPDLLEGLVGSRSELARSLAERFHFPLAPHDREGLPQVAQFLFVQKKKHFLEMVLLRSLCSQVRRRHMNSLPSEERTLDLEQIPRRKLLELLDRWLLFAWKAEQARNPAEPYWTLANLPLPIYITADPSNLLIYALKQAGKDPQVLFSPWNDYTRNACSNSTVDEVMPTPQQPLVYRLFGSYQEPDSLVLTEDNHFDYLIGITQNKGRIPAIVREQLVDTALLMLGFRPDDGTFRVVFRSMMNQSGAPRLAHYAHLAVQVAPEEGRALSPRHAQSYLEEYFTGNFTNKDAFNINLYWGRAADFIRELHTRLGGHRV